MLKPLIYAPPKGEVPIIHIDDEFLIVSKPAGLLSVPGKAAEHSVCLESRIQAIYPQARIVHRLDMATSGIMVMAMNAKAHRHLGLQFERRHVKKTYVANVWGKVEQDEGEIDLPLRCDWPNRPLQMVDHEQGKSAQTSWQVLERGTHSTKLLLKPKTGRSHQLRVHLLVIGHPILGDEFYAKDEALEMADRLMLHAQSLEFFHPCGGVIQRFKDLAPF